MTIEYEEFAKVELRSGRIIEVDDFPRAKKPAYKIKVDFGEFGIKQTSAQVTQYKKEELLGKLVVGCINLEPKNIAGYTSEFLLVGLPSEDGKVCLITAEEKNIPNGAKLF